MNYFKYFRYIGFFKGGIRHGLGRYEHADGSIYEGEFKGDKYSGKGELKTDIGDR